MRVRWDGGRGGLAILSSVIEPTVPAAALRSWPFFLVHRTLKPLVGHAISRTPYRRRSVMPMSASEIEKRIKAAIPDAVIELRDLAGDDNHWAATVISEQFRGK